MPDWMVYKFGGSSLANADCFRQVADNIRRHDRSLAVVVSAVGGVTDLLIAALARAAARDADYGTMLDQVRDRHLALAEDLLDAQGTLAWANAFEPELADVRHILHAASLLRHASVDSENLVSGMGEVWSARLLAAYLRQLGESADWLDAREILILEHGELGPVVDWAASRQRLQAALAESPARIRVITGYVAQDHRGVATTLGRNGSDHSASIFGALFDAAEIHIWTDVDGILSGDPRLVPEVAVMDSLSYSEAMELAYFGAKVIHPRTMAPAIEHGIPLVIRNTFAPDKPGTRIAAVSGGQDIKGITSIHGMALVNLEGAGMIGVPGTAMRVFAALREADISVVLISQASSEHSICFALPEGQADAARAVLQRAFRNELDQGAIQDVGVTRDCSILAVVGDGMGGRPGVAAKVFGTLGRAGVNVRAIAQGSSERNISAVIDRADAARAVRAVHAGFYLSPQTVSIGLIGPGNVGGVLLDQIAGERDRLAADSHLDLRVRAIASSSRMLLGTRAIGLEGWRDHWDGAETPLDLQAFVRHVQAEHIPHAVIIDCSASAQVASHYAEWLAAGIHVVTPNKKANTTDMPAYRRLRAAGRSGGAHYLYETTVGAGLPIIHTLRDLRETGDEILRIEGILSGTLAYLFNSYDGEQPFSELVRGARQGGLTEPDPRDDLSGMDVARKVVILGREMGLDLELADVAVESLVPAALAEVSVDEFLAGMARYDEGMREMWAAARDEGRVLRYTASLTAAGDADVKLARIPATHGFAHMNPTDNMVRFVTRRYRDNPLVVQGPGAGPEVTAAGVFADLLRLCAYLGATP
jgi:aspartokinase/homoserine dehydrogenase 1